ncbi:Cof-type HAD-IIB family hydrolase [Pediococcus argentinicus]|uniref:HAD superfamily hydrolase n=1 Tax=Pediococcus argentinicus TaxID=480391 RepID=A0A0R2NI45_9LACO|nr:Cof-type HAD-IIB family hydrolase [Pediococcus argentinicus]KRO25462.1 hypothetical protein IV88_GL001712 [Pediococcus argentinicus]NKZ22158.1 Cof-type HAD-IIB family hydrolase [Pediococcus argentinicus]GEP19205.1 haloacid dehalogenase [Pediococcus argentinicus]
MAVQLIASDIDGTFLNDEHTFDKGLFQQQLQEMNDRNLKFVVASGNQYAHCQDVFEGIDGDMTYVTENGGLIVEQGKILDESPLDPNLMRDFLDYLFSTPIFEGVTVILSTRNRAYTNVTPDAVDWDLDNYFYRNLISTEDFKSVKDPIYKIDTHWANLDDVRDKADVLRKDLGSQLGSVLSGFSGIDIMPSHVNKAYGLQQLQHIWNISMDETMAFGDNENDKAMLQHARLGYAMKNAAPEAKDATKLITPLDNNDSGVMDLIGKVLDGRVN